MFTKDYAFSDESIFQPAPLSDQLDDRIENVPQHVRNPDEYRVGIVGAEWSVSSYSKQRLISLKE